MRIATSLIVLAFVTSPLGALAWGTQGHRVTGEIAWQNLSAEAKRGVARALPRGRYSTLYEGATWADTYARRYPRFDHLKPHHYISAAPFSDSVNSASTCGDSGCVISAIRDNACKLKAGAGSATQRRQALFLLAHFVGDIHQPLHVAHPDGRGGNRTKPRFYGVRTKLHAIWDTAMIEHHLEQYAQWDDDEWEPDPDLEDTDTVTWDIYAAELAATLPDGVSTWANELDPEAWANESLTLAKDHGHEIEASDSLGDAYYERVMPVISRRLQMSGVRLAAVLNRVFSSEALPYDCS